MCHIDEAFINAYADPSAPSRSAALPASPPRRERGPSLRIFSHAVAHGGAEHRVDSPQSHAPTLSGLHSNVEVHTTFAEVAAHQPTEVLSSAELSLPSKVSECKPLSAFASAKPVLNEVFKPAFEVDRFRWPAITEDLITTSTGLLIPVVEMLVAGAADGQVLVGVGGSDRRVGTSTVVMCLARLIAGSGRNVALVDGNFLQGDLGCTLGLEFDLGWEDVLTGNLPLAECAVASVADNITLVPLGGAAESESERLSSIQSSVIAGILRHHHDLVLIDLGSASEPRQLTAIRGMVEHCRIDVGIAVTPVSSSSPIVLHGLDRLTAVFGNTYSGAIGNRAS